MHSVSILCGALTLSVAAITEVQAVDPGNTFYGTGAGAHNTTGEAETAFGGYALYSDTIGSDNTATGDTALYYNTNGNGNTANGTSALYYNTGGFSNTAIGVAALQANTTGNYNTATGANALFFNTTGESNTSSGIDSLFHNTTGSYNIATGLEALFSNTTGNCNIGTGMYALNYNTTGNYNIATGYEALLNNTTGSNNIALGNSAGSILNTGSYNIYLAALGEPAESGTIRLGRIGRQKNTYIAGISGRTVADGVEVVVDSKGHLGTVTSSERYKEAIEPMAKTSETILSLQPVTFRYKKELDPKAIPQFGLVAEQVAKVAPDLVARDEQGKAYTVRYEAVNAMLLNEFIKEHRKVEEQAHKLAAQDGKAKEQDATISELKSALARQQQDTQAAVVRQQKQIDALTSQIQKVSDQVQMQGNGPTTAYLNP